MRSFKLKLLECKYRLSSNEHFSRADSSHICIYVVQPQREFLPSNSISCNIFIEGKGSTQNFISSFSFLITNNFVGLAVYCNNAGPAGIYAWIYITHYLIYWGSLPIGHLN